MGDYSTPVLPTPDGYSPLRSMAEATLPYSSASVSAPGGTEEGGTRKIITRGALGAPLTLLS